MSRPGRLLAVAAAWLGLLPRSHCQEDVLAAAVDDECSVADAGAEDGACALNALQLRARSQARAAGSSSQAGLRRASRVAEHEEGIHIKSSFFVGSGVSPAVDCTTNEVSGASGGDGDGGAPPRAALYSSFGAGGGGAVWSFQGLVIMDAPASNEVELGHRVNLSLTVTAQSASWSLTPYEIIVEGQRNEVEMPLNFTTRGTPDCPPRYCLVPHMYGGNLPDRISAPKCGFAPPSGSRVSGSGPAQGETRVVELDITELVATGYTSYKVFAAPTTLERRGMWQIPGLTVTAWGFHWVARAVGAHV